MLKNILFIILVFNVSSAQVIKVGFRIEPTILISEQGNNTSTGFNPYSVYLTAAVSPIKDLSFEIRPGYLLWGDYYGGFEIGAFAKWNILSSKIFIQGGILNHDNLDTGHNGGGSYEKSILYKGLGVGYQVDSKLSVDISYYWSNDSIYGYSNIRDYISYSYQEYIRMKGILKLGFCLTWDII